MEEQKIRFRIKYFFTATLLSVSLIALSVFLKSETPLKEEVITQPEEVVQPTIYDESVAIIKGSGQPIRDYNHRHIHSAKAIGVGSLVDTSGMNKMVSQRKLIKVQPDKGYALAAMTHSYPFLTPDAVRVLRKIGASFYESSGDESFFTVTSLTRTEETQKKLRRRNSNAAKTESSHCYGVSFDISYIRYNGVREWHYERTKKLEGILAEMQRNGEIYVLKEKNQSCFHVSVRDQN